MRSPGQVDVELVEDGAEPPVVAEPSSPWRDRLREVPVRTRAAVAGAVVLVLAGAVTSDVLADRREAARVARVEGRAVSLAAPLREVWSAPGEWVSAVVGGDTVVVDGRNRLRGAAAVDRARDEVLWRHEVAGDGYCWIEEWDALEPARGAVHTLPDAEAGAVACVEGVEEAGEPHTQVSVLDLVTGEVQRRIRLDVPGQPMPAGGDVVSTGIDVDGHAVAGRWSLRTGERLWAYRGPAVQARSWDDVSTSTDEEAATWTWPGGTVRLDLGTGQETTSPEPDDAGREYEQLVLPDGATVLGTFPESTGPRLAVREGDGSLRFEVDGALLWTWADDGTASDTLFVTSPGGRSVAAVDVHDGTERWRATVDQGEAAVLSGLLVVRDGTETTALDARTGHVVWVADDRWSPQEAPGIVTDGSDLLTLARRDSRAVVVARELRTGRTLWQVPAPEGARRVDVLPDGTVVVQATVGVVALAP